MLKQINVFFFAFLGFFMFFYVLYNRLIVVKLTKELGESVSFGELLFYMFLSFLFTYLFFSSVWNFFFKSKKKSFFFKVQRFIIKCLDEFYKNVIERLLLHLVDLSKIYGKINKILINIFDTRIKKWFFLFFIDIFPKLLVLFFLIIDVFLYKKICFFYQFSVLLLLPLFTNYLIHIYTTLYTQDIARINNYVIFSKKYDSQDLSMDDFFKCFCIQKEFFLEDYDCRFSQQFLLEHLNVYYNEKNTLNLYVHTLLLGTYFPSKMFFETLLYYKESYSSYLNLVLFSFYAIIWSYIVYCSFWFLV